MRPWAEVFIVLIVCHLVGDYLFQTEWQALHKHGGLVEGGTKRRALFAHVTTYTLAFVPALIWLWSGLHAGVIYVAALVFLPHLVQDDGTLLVGYAKTFKKADIRANPSLGAALDQAFHIITLFLIAIIAGA
jgi:hypothetical protein